MSEEIRGICREITERIEKVHIACFEGHDKPLFLISETYPGIWLEHVYDSVFYAGMKPEFYDIAVNTVRIFIENQKENGQLPCFVWDHARVGGDPTNLVGYGQTQECVSFAKLCLMLWKMRPDRAFLEEIYSACKKWENWFRTYRMTTGRGLVEMFVGYDTGHDNSERVSYIKYGGSHKINGKPLPADAPPDPDDSAPIFAVDMNCNLYATDKTLSEMALLLGKNDESAAYIEKAEKIKENLFRYCFDKEDCFFYDVDKNGEKRKIRSSTIFHLFLEGVLNPEKDKELIAEIYRRYLHNPNEFWSAYPFPAVSVSEPSRERHKIPNSWGYYSQALIALRCTMWMDKYGFSADFDELCRRWVEAVTKNYSVLPFGQELDPETGEVTRCSQWYSSCMLFYLYASRRLGFVE